MLSSTVSATYACASWREVRRRSRRRSRSRPGVNRTWPGLQTPRPTRRRTKAVDRRRVRAVNQQPDAASVNGAYGDVRCRSPSQTQDTVSRYCCSGSHRRPSWSQHRRPRAVVARCRVSNNRHLAVRTAERAVFQARRGGPPA